MFTTCLLYTSVPYPNETVDIKELIYIGKADDINQRFSPHDKHDLFVEQCAVGEYCLLYTSGWAITISLKPTFEVRDRCGLSTSTRKMIQKIWQMCIRDST